MRGWNLRGIQVKTFKGTTNSQFPRAVTPDLLRQEFLATAPNEKWTADIPYVWTDEGWLYQTVMMDLYSQALVGVGDEPRPDPAVGVSFLNDGLVSAPVSQEHHRRP